MAASRMTPAMPLPQTTERVIVAALAAATNTAVMGLILPVASGTFDKAYFSLEGSWILSY